MKMKKRIWAILLATSVLAGVTAEAKVSAKEMRGEMQSVKEISEPGETLSPEETSEPGETLSPEETPEPGETLSPEETPEPDETLSPEETSTPSETPKLKVTGVKTTAMGKRKVKIKWNQCQGAEGYIVYRKKGDTYKQYKKTTKENCIVRELKEGKKYIFRVVPYTNHSGFVKGIGQSISYNNKEIVATNHQKYSYKEMSADMKALKKKYDGLVSYEVIGKSEDNRKIYDVIVGNPKAKKALLVISSLHAREYMTSLLSMKQIEYYLEKYYGKIAGKSVQKNLQKIAIHYIPMANPDGVTISQYGKKAIRKASLRRALYKMKGDATRWKANARGVDLNRNFPDKFNVYGKRSGEGYSGPSVASESETKAIVNLLNNLKQNNRLKGVVNYHAMGSIIFGDTKGNAIVRKNTKKMYQLAKAITGYGSAAGYKSSVPGSGGSLREYIMRKKHVASITLEIGRIYCPGPIREFPNIWKRNKTLVFREATLFT